MKIQMMFTCTCGRKMRINLSLRTGIGSGQATCRKCRTVWKADDPLEVKPIGTRPLVRKTWMGATDAGTEGKACHETVEALTNPGHPWLSICHTHGRLICHDSWALARYSAEHTSVWCECCDPEGCGYPGCKSCGTAGKNMNWVGASKIQCG